MIRPKLAVCLLCDQEKQIYARGGCYGCWLAAKNCGMLDEWLEKGKPPVPDPSTRDTRNKAARDRANEGRMALSRDPQAAHEISYDEDDGLTQAVCPCGYASLRFTGDERPQTAGAAHLLAMTFLGGRDA